VGDRAARRRAENQAATGAGIAEIEDAIGRLEAADADAVHAPNPLARALDAGAKGAHGLGGIEHILPFEQPRDPRFTDRQRAEDQRPVRDRLIAGHADAAAQRRVAAGGEGRWCDRLHGVDPMAALAVFPYYHAPLAAVIPRLHGLAHVLIGKPPPTLGSSPEGRLCRNMRCGPAALLTAPGQLAK